MKIWKSAIRILFVSFAALAGQAAWACSVCPVASGEARNAYYTTTAMMSFLPLMIIGAVVYFLFKKSR